MKKLVLVFLAVLLTLSVGCTAEVKASDVQPTDRFFVNDFADVIDQTDEDTMYAAGVQLFEKTGAQVVVVTLDSIGGRDIDEYGVELGRAWGIGDEEDDTGLLLLLAMEEREVAISVGYGLEGAVTDMQSGIFLDTYALPYFEDEDYSTGLAATYDALVNEVYLEFGLEADPDYVPIDEVEEESEESIIGIVAFLIVLCVISALLRHGRRVHPGFFVFPSGGFHHHGGGGFGSGGGGFGGFRGGGGSFGGGGASRGF